MSIVRSRRRQDNAPFERAARIIRKAAGIALSPAKSSLILSRLNKRIIATGSADLTGYLDLIEGPEGEAEMPFMISALTTNVTHFFRERHHFETLERQVLPELANRPSGQPIRIWSAGCSSGQEAYSVAMIAHAAGARTAEATHIHGTDIDHSILDRARMAEYSAAEMENIPRAMIFEHFHKTPTGYKVRGPLARMVSFDRMNLVAAWPAGIRYDVIFCRNVVIYFDAATQAELWRRFHQALSPGGWLFIGHSERIAPEAQNLFNCAGITTYRQRS
ncbi:CheR family methyltransferase [Paracoccus pacificus]|uniref:Chemotaxis protein methyltransferase n=1 Tax=Paracoccus pacificus TaxID=1463598 RepID=A0ABW4R5H2_9RHOB